MLKRMTIMLIAVAVVLTALGFAKYRQISAAIAEGASYAPPPEAVTTIVADRSDWGVTLGAIGTVTAAQGVLVSADLPGLVDSIEFNSGERVAAGDVLVRLDSRQEQAQLTAAEAREHLAQLNFDRLKVLREKSLISQAEFDQLDAELRQARAEADEIRATIERKIIRAPFGGILGIRQVNLGQYVSAGDGIVPLQSLNPVYVDFSVPQHDLPNMKVGATVDVLVEGISGVAANGRITAVNSVIDESTRNAQVQATFNNAEGVLRPGMFVQVSVNVGQSESVIAIPSSSISFTPYGDFVFVVEEMTGANGQKYKGVRQQVVRLGSARGDQVAVMEGVQPGEEVVTSGVFKLRGGAAVTVTNEVQPGNDPTPKPADS